MKGTKAVGGVCEFTPQVDVMNVMRNYSVVI